MNLESITIAIPDNALRLTSHGLVIAIHRIPHSLRRHFDKPAYSWVGESVDHNGQRWCLVKVQFIYR